MNPNPGMVPDMRRRTFLAGSAATLSSVPIFKAAGSTEPSVRFPRNFVWGISTSAYQIEGGLQVDGRGLSIWDGVFADGDGLTAEPTADHYRRWREDVRLLERLGVSAYRFSIAWPRILPEGAHQVNPLGLDFYDRIVDRLLAAGITPFVCLHHWDLPKALQDSGGWLNREIVDHFTAYALIVADRLGDRVQHWIAINEACALAYGGYGIGYWPPYIANEDAYFAAAHHLNLAQGAAFKALAAPGRKLGTAMSLYPIRPATQRPEDAAAARFHESMTTEFFLDPLIHGRYADLVAARVEPFVRGDDLAVIQHPIDFLGVNYYEPEYRYAAPGAYFGIDNMRPADVPKTDVGLLIDPAGLYDQLIHLRDRYGNTPIYITENGAAYHDNPDQEARIHDVKRIAFLREHLVAAHRAIVDGVNLQGYFVWSLCDDWEWRFGFTWRFGLVYLDIQSGQRTPKSSFDWYTQIVRNGVV